LRLCPATAWSRSLSAFDKRRLQVARAIVSAPVLAVIDEPLRGLDAFAQAVMRDLLKNFRTQEGPAFLVITSDIMVAQSLAEDAMIMKDGRVIERGSLADILRAPKAAYTLSLIEASAPVKNSALPPAVPQG
jgi:ABC-type microcin C transport system duplicated ATPase subunit YejF